MKKTIITIIFIGMTVTLFYACKKNTDKQIPDTLQVAEYTPAAMDIWKRLNTFNQRLKDVVSRDNVLIPADSVIWYLESMLNIQVSKDTTFCDLYKHETSYTASIDENGYVAMSELTILFNQMVLDIEYQLDQIDSDYKYLIIADLFEGSSRTGNLEIGLDGIFAINRFEAYTPFTDIDDWYYGNMLGRSDGAYEYVSDGGQQLKLRINNQGIKPTFQYNTWLNPQQSPILNATNTQNRMWAKIATGPPIINDTDMMVYLQNMHYLIYNSETDTPDGYFSNEYGSEMYFRLINFWTSGEPNSTGYYFHEMNILYGEPVYIPIIE